MKPIHARYVSLVCAAAIGFLYGSTGCNSTGISISECSSVLTEKDDGAQTTLARNKTLCVKLPAQFGTGYSWQLKSSGEAVTLKGQPETESGPGKRLPGGTDYQIFRFTARSAGTADVELHYLRPWLKEQTPPKVFRFKATVVE